MTIEAVIFDLGGVLAQLDGARVVQELARLAGKPVGQIRAAFEAGMRGAGAIIDYERGRSSCVEVHRWALRELDLTAASLPLDLFCRLWCETITPDLEMGELFRRCCRARRTCVLSNTNDLHWNWVALHHDLLQHAAATLTSFETGYYKPEPEIYELALVRFGVTDPASAVFIDDRPENVEAAQRAGLVASFAHVDAAATRARLQALGVC